ncbi:HPF/RaiA family ribosome-associated protein [Winogradskyella litorisediminis]|uniref:HPF/RaiA family ribosome-associated protein n=1 Tax=Winogradskyella litorisediminis TaxID=1156618 RepID=A0ABW3N2I1_9FLAO
MSEIIFEYNGVTQSDALETYTKNKLERIFNRFEFVHRADVFFKTENTSSDETGMIAGIRLSAPGPRLFAESSKDEFQPAVAECVDELLKQLEKRKASMQTY